MTFSGNLLGVEIDTWSPTSEMLARIAAQAVELFGNSEKAETWLQRSNRALKGKAPLTAASTIEGAAAVETLLGRISHGIAA